MYLVARVPKGLNSNSIHHKFADILDDKGLVQMVVQPIRESSTLDLI